MKKFNFLFCIFTVGMLLWGMGAKAQTQVSNATDLIQAVSDLSATGGTITLVAPFDNSAITGVTIPTTALGIGTANQGASITLQADAPITIDCGANKITVYCANGSSGIVGNLVIGNNITVTGTGAVTVDNVNKGVLDVTTGGVVENRNTASGGMAVSAAGGRCALTGGTIATYSPNGFALNSTASNSVSITGGTIGINASGATGINLSGTPGTYYDFKNVDIESTASNTTGIHIAGGWSEKLMNITINNTDKAIVADVNSAIVIPSGDGTKINSTTPYSGAGSIVDFGSSITIIPSIDPSVSVTDPQTITFTATCTNPNVNSGASVAVAAPIVASSTSTLFSSAPTSAIVTANPSATVTAATPTVYAAVASIGNIAISATNWAFYPNTPKSFTYTIDTGSGDDTGGGDTGGGCDGPVTTFAELQNAYNCSQSGPAGTTTIEITKYFAITSDFTMNPSSDHPVVINMDTSFVTNPGTNTTFEGALTINTPVYNAGGTTILKYALIVGGNTTFGPGLIFNDNVAGGNNPGIELESNATLTINGGTYTTSNQGSLIYLSVTSSAGTTSTGGSTLIINDGVFNVDYSSTTASANIRAIQTASNNNNITINGGTFNVGLSGRVIYINGGSGTKAAVNGGTFTVKSNAASFFASVNSGSATNNTVEIDGGTFDVGSGIFMGLGQNNSLTTTNNFVIKAADNITATTIFNNTSTYTGSANQKYYDFRGYLLAPSVAPGVIAAPVSVTLSLSASATPDPVDAAGLTIDNTYYYVTDASGTKSAVTPYTGAITINPGDTLTAYVMTTDGVAGNAQSFVYGDASSTTTTTWNPQSSGSTDWTLASNWTNGVPTATSTAIIPQSASYPVLIAPASVAEIHFQSGAQIGGQSNLTGKAFVQYDFSSSNRERWNMLSIPLMQVYPGDFTFGGYPQTWVRTFTTSTEGSITEGVWTTLHDSGTPFSSGDGFVIWLNADDNTSYPQDANKGLQALQNGGMWELPSFQHYMAGSPDINLYQAVNQAQTYVSSGTDTGTSTFCNVVNSGGQYVPGATSYTANRDASAYQLAGATVEKTLSFLSNDEAGGSFALTGNPYMAALDFDALYANAANASVIKPCYQIWTDNGTTKGYVAYTQTGYSGLITDHSLTNYIAPLQAFLVENSGSSTAAPLQFTEGMTSVNTAAALRSSGVEGNKLDIIARNPVAGVLTFIAKRDGGQDEFGNMDARKIINGVTDVPEIYTLKPYNGNSIAVGANVINTGDLLIPVGLATSYTGDITLSFSGMDSYDANLSLVDAATNSEIDLTGLASYDYTVNYTPKTVNGTATATEDRLFIRISKTVTGLTGTAIEKANVYESNGFIQAVSGASNPIKEVEVYNQQGALIYKNSSINAISYTVDRNLPVGAYIVKVISEKSADNVKIIVR